MVEKERAPLTGDGRAPLRPEPPRARLTDPPARAEGWERKETRTHASPSAPPFLWGDGQWCRRVGMVEEARAPLPTKQKLAHRQDFFSYLIQCL